MSASRYHDLVALMLGLAVLVADQLTKLWIVQYFGVEGLRPPIPILGDVLTLYYVQNTGVAFSLFEGQNVRFLLIALAFGLICYLYWHYRESATLWLRLGFALVLGGATGNLLDRFARSFVVDFVHFQIPGVFDFAVFNVADSAITIGAALLVIDLLRTRKAPPA
jgi:signal peptidase II